MAFTQEQLDGIDAAIASGELTVTFEGRTVTYRSMTDLIAARDLIKRSLAADAGGTSAPTIGGRTYGLADFSRGCE